MKLEIDKAEPEPGGGEMRVMEAPLEPKMKQPKADPTRVND
jgi:hypothetical protein